MSNPWEEVARQFAADARLRIAREHVRLCREVLVLGEEELAKECTPRRYLFLADQMSIARGNLEEAEACLRLIAQ